MRDLLFYSMLTFFSIYGFLSFAFFIADFIFESFFLKDRKIYMLVAVKNEVCKIENITRGLLFKIFKNDVGISEQRLIVLDLGSDDGTLDTLKKLSNNESGFSVYQKEELMKKLDIL